jgi:RimJ/RimL family protein N-acetyltransferase
VHFDYQPVLKGELVELRPLRADDYGALFAVASDPLLWQQHPAEDRHESSGFQKFFDGALASASVLAAIGTRSGDLIGSSRYHGYDANRSEIEIGWSFLARSHWGGTYNGEMKRLMLTHAFRFVERVVLLVGPDNLRSQRAVEKIGGVRAGSRPDAALWALDEVDPRWRAPIRAAMRVYDDAATPADAPVLKEALAPFVAAVRDRC